MKRDISKKITVPFGLALSVLVILGIASYHRSSNYRESYAQVAGTFRLLSELDHARDIATAADSGVRVYVLTGDSGNLRPYQTAREELKRSLALLKELAASDPGLQRGISSLESNGARLFDGMDAAVSERQQGETEKAARMLLSGEARSRVDEFRRTANGMDAVQRRLLDQKSRAAAKTAQFESILFSALALIAMLLLGTVGAIAVADFNRRKESEDTLARTNATLNTWVTELERRTTEMTLIAEMGEWLQVCHNSDEAYLAVQRSCPRLFPTLAGAVYILNVSANMLDPVVIWGQGEEPDIAQPGDCWALRNGRIHLVDNRGADLLCGHLPAGFQGFSLCIPMLAHGEALGVFHLREKVPGEMVKDIDRLAKTAAEHIALSVANLRLQGTLRDQSIRDALTGMFNRRYMEETLEREIRRAERSHRNVGIIMLDVDHFKQFNDTYGHDAGDALLSTLGAFLRNNVRAEDIACRYGGEEFALILPDATPEMTHKRAEQILQDARGLDIERDGVPRSPIRLSLGVATYPENGLAGDAVMRAADTALYEAKNDGRNRVMFAQSQPPSAGGTAGDEQQAADSRQSAAANQSVDEMEIPGDGLHP